MAIKTKTKQRASGEPLTGVDATKQFRAMLREEFTRLLADGGGTASSGAKIETPEDAEKEERKQVGILQEKVDRLEAQLAAKSMSVPGSADSERSKGEEKYSFRNVVLALTSAQGGDHGAFERLCPRELEMHRAVATREHGMVDDPSLGFLVPGEVHDEFFEDLLLPRVIAFNLGIKRISVSGSPVRIPVLAARPTVDNVAENTGGTASQVELGEIAMTPKSCQSEVNISRDLLRSAPGAEGLIRGFMADEMVRRLSEWILLGNGGANEPVGILNTAGIGSVDFSGVTVGAGAVPTNYYTKFVEMVGVVEDANAMVDGASMGWALPTKAKRAAQQVRTDPTTAAHIALANRMISAGPDAQILGYNYQTSNQLASGSETEIIFGDFGKVLFAEWGGIRIEASNVAHYAFRKNQTIIIARTMGDVAVTQPAALAQSSGLDLSTF